MAGNSSERGMAAPQTVEELIAYTPKIELGVKSLWQFEQDFRDHKPTGIPIWHHAGQMLRNVFRAPHTHEEVGVAFLRGLDLGFGQFSSFSFNELLVRLQDSGFSPARQDLAPYLREALDFQPVEEIFVASRPINLSDGTAHIFALGQQMGGLWFDSHRVVSEKTFHPSDVFAAQAPIKRAK